MLCTKISWLHAIWRPSGKSQTGPGQVTQGRGSTEAHSRFECLLGTPPVFGNLIARKWLCDAVTLRAKLIMSGPGVMLR